MVFIQIYSKRNRNIDITEYTKISIRKFKEKTNNEILLLGYKDNNFIYYKKVGNDIYVATKETNIRKDSYYIESYYKNEK